MTQPKKHRTPPLAEQSTFAQLLEHLWCGGDWAYWWTVSEKKKLKDGTETKEAVCKRSYWFPVGKSMSIPDEEGPEGSQHIYFGVHPVTENRGDYGRATLATVAAINCLFAEFDGPALEKIEAIDPPPSVVIESSPGKYHAYWLLQTTLFLDSKETLTRARRIQEAWVLHVGSDGGAKDLARVLRVPGTRNVKAKYGPDYPTVIVLFAHFDRLYNLEQFEEEASAFLSTDKPATHNIDYDNDPIVERDKVRAALAGISSA